MTLIGPTSGEVLAGKPFETSGCLYCNRPYYTRASRAGHDELSAGSHRAEALEALSECGLASSAYLREGVFDVGPPAIP